MKQLVKFVAGCIALCFATFASAQTVLKLAHYADTAHPAHTASQQFAKNVESRTKGQVKVEIYPANQLGSPPEQLQQAKLGTVDMALPTHGQMDKFEKAFAAVILPFAFDDLAHAYRTLDSKEAMDWLAPLAEKQGFIMLSNWDWGFRNLTNSKRPINKPEEVAGLKIRVPPEMQLEAAMAALGAQVTKIAFPELYMSLSQGVVDGQENPISVILSNKIYEVQKHLAITKHAYNSMIHVINADKWKKLTPEQQKIVREESKAAGELMRKELASAEAEQIKKLEAAGMQVTRPDTKIFQAKMDPAYKKISEYAGEANVQKFQKIVQANRKK
jgi:TRAP-type transport system periplasmic protein